MIGGAVQIPIPPTGNHRIHESGTVSYPPGNGKGNCVCPRCKTNLFAGTRKYRTKAYENWLEKTGSVIVAHFGSLRGHRLKVTVHIYGGRGVWEERVVKGVLTKKLAEGFAESRDLDNAIKCLGDCLKECKVIRDDSVRYIAEWSPRYFTLEEHLAILGDSRPSRKSDVYAKCYIKVESLGLISED